MKKNKQPAHTTGDLAAGLRSWSGPVETDFQGRLRFSYANRPVETPIVGMRMGAEHEDRLITVIGAHID